MGEVIELTYVNVVGLISNDEEFSEIENVATIFIIEERMKHITYSIKSKDVFKSKLLSKNRLIVKDIKKLKVRGFN
jgi:hypothetical protein